MNKEKWEKTLRSFREMRLPIMAEQIHIMIENNELTNLTIEDVLIRISDEELNSRRNNTINRLKKKSKLSQKHARLEEIDYRPERHINRSVIEQLITNDYIVKHRNVLLLGACGTGKSYIANALGNHSCESFYSTYYCRLFEYLNECHLARLHVGSSEEIIKKYLKYEVLIIDDFLISELMSEEANNLFKLIEYRHNSKSTIICSQLEPQEWHSKLGGSILAESILDRIISNAYKLILDGESMRKNQVSIDIT